MTKLIILLFAAGLITCSQSQTRIFYQISTYDDPGFANRISDHKQSLKRLSDAGVFSNLSSKLTNSLSEVHKNFFRGNPDYEVISFSRGDLFQNQREDHVFVVYDKKSLKLIIIVYDEKTNRYCELYRGVQVENGLLAAECNFGHTYTLDYQLASEIIYLEETLVMQPDILMNLNLCKITDISRDNTFILDRGCFSNQVPKTDFSSSLCIATSSVYNNWECMRYDKTKELFIIFYGQAFAD